MADPSPPALPRGRHTLTREQVRASQRDRMLLGMAEAVAERGYARTTVADVLRRGGVSRETFYENFAGKEECYLAALDRGSELLLLAVEAESRGGAGGPVDRFGRALHAYLDAMAAEPGLAAVVLLESLAAGQPARERRFAVQERFVATLAAALAEDQGWRGLPDPEFTCRVLVAAIGSMVTSALVAGSARDLPDLHAPVMRLVHHLVGGTEPGGTEPGGAEPGGAG